MRYLSTSQLEAVLVPEALYKPVLPEWYEFLEQDQGSSALQGGIPSLKLCNAALPASGLGPDLNSSYVSVPVGARPDIYYGSDAASLTEAGAEQLLEEAAGQAPTCGWRSVPGPKLDDQVVRLTTDRETGEGELHVDVVLVRAGGSVAEIGTATTSGVHSADAENLAVGAAKRLGQAVRSATAA